MTIKRILLLMVSLAMLLSLTATAAANPHDWSHESYQHNSWVHADHQAVSFTWGEHRSHFMNRYEHLTPLDDHEWRHRFPGLQAYRWHSRGYHDSFLYHGERITHGVMFFNHADRLVGVGFMHNGSFVFIRDDHRSFRNHDSFYVSWSNR